MPHLADVVIEQVEQVDGSVRIRAYPRQRRPTVPVAGSGRRVRPRRLRSRLNDSLHGVDADPAPANRSAEGTAEYGVDLAHRGDGERLAPVWPAARMAFVLVALVTLALWVMLDVRPAVAAAAAAQQIGVEAFHRLRAEPLEFRQGDIAERRFDELGNEQLVALACLQFDAVSAHPFIEQIGHGNRRGTSRRAGGCRSDPADDVCCLPCTAV